MESDENKVLGEMVNMLETACEQLTGEVAKLKANARIIAKQRTNEVARLKEKIVWLQAEISELLGLFELQEAFAAHTELVTEYVERLKRETE